MKLIVDFLKDNKIEYRLNEPMNLHTTFRIGGNASVFAILKSKDQLKSLLAFCGKNGVKPFILGNGSNLLVNDKGIDNLVITLDGDFSKIDLIDETTIEVGAAVQLSALCRFALKNKLSGLEFAYGIPGSVGGAVYMNAGAYGGEMKNVVSFVSHVDYFGNEDSFSQNQLSFGYRKSAYSNDKYVITSAIIKLTKGEEETIKASMNDLIQRRKDKQPLDYPSAGSTFKRPEGYFAGALIEQSGLKGKQIGGAQVSEKHAGFVINKNNASCEDVLNLIEHCRKTVKEKFGVTLETEVKII